MSRFRGRLLLSSFTHTGLYLNGRQMAYCTKEDEYEKNGKCCKRCNAGLYVKTECDGTKQTVCDKCGPGSYTATKNHLLRCQLCKHCSKNQREVKSCTSEANTVCECKPGYYCSHDHCEECEEVTHCGLGFGVKVPARGTNDTICGPCEPGTFSNVSDYISTCRAHTRCEHFGRENKTHGTPTADAICGNFITRSTDCPWMLPAGLWSGLVLTALILFGVICWRTKRKSYKANKKETKNFVQPIFKSTEAGCSLPVTVIELLPAASQHVSLPTFTEINGHCQESCAVQEHKLPLFTTDDNLVSCDTLDSSRPITPLKVSVSFTESSHIKGSAGYCNGNFLRTYSEPQEDEWCGA